LARSIEDETPKRQKGYQKDELGLASFGSSIRKNRSTSKPRAEDMEALDLSEIDGAQTPIHFSKLKARNYDRIARDGFGSKRKSIASSFQDSRAKEYGTMDLESINEENIEDSLKFINPRFVEIPNSRATLQPKELCSKVMTKFESDHKKFQKFLVRERSRAKNKSQRYVEGDKSTMSANPEISKCSLVNDLAESYFEGTIVKNISRTLHDDEEYIRNHSKELSFLSKKILGLIAAAQRKQDFRRQICFTKLSIPDIPSPPKPSTSPEVVMDLILRVLPFSGQTYSEKDMVGCSLKKYKNCIMFELPNNPGFRIVWHYAGKLYMGEWDSQRNEKSGEGLEYVRDRYFYKGQFSSGKKYGKGILIQSSGCLY
jgi:hypothetical protein